MAMNLYQIIKKTDARRVAGAKYVKLTNVKVGYDEDGKAYIYCKSYSTHRLNEDGQLVKNLEKRRYVTYIKFIDNKLNVIVSCSCDDFLFREEVALERKGAAEIYYSNGEMPTTTNPKLKPYCCKHLVALYNHIKPKLPSQGRP